MPAQLGSGVVLSYGPQGAQQSGAAVVLDTLAGSGSTRVSATFRAPWGASARKELAVRAPFLPSAEKLVATRAPWGVSGKQDAQHLSPWVPPASEDVRSSAPWGVYGGRAQPESRSRWAPSAPSDQQSASPWGIYGGRAQPENRSRWAPSAPSDQRSAAPWGGPMLRAELLAQMGYARAAQADMLQRVPWVKYSTLRSRGIGVSIPPDDGVPTSLIVVPIRRVYMQVNTSSLRKVDGDIMLPVHSMRLQLDRDSWVWSFSASMPADTQSYLEPEDGVPVEVEAMVNGEFFRFLVEDISRDRSFGRAAISVSGRGKTALLDAPYARAQNFAQDGARTLAQLMDDVLSEGGVSLGWTVNFSPEDWLVPAGVFSHRGTHISALNELAAAAGAYVQPHPTADELSVLMQYPYAPWDWLTDVDPDFELPSAVVTREGIRWTSKPRYNRVYVSGVREGVLGRVTRAGSAGDLLAPMVADPLIVTAAAARQRGLPVLADVGRQASVSLRLPVLDETGVIVPGKFVKYVDGATERVGLVRGVSLDIGSPQVWQTIELETHLEPV